MNRTVARIALALLTAVAVLAQSAVVASAVDAEPGPAYRDSREQMDAALDCDGDLAGSSRLPVLLLPAIGMSPKANFGWGFQRALRAKGHPVCGISFPDNGGADLQLSAEYVTYAVRKLNAESGRKVSMIGHSLGGVPGVWATQFWPDLAGKVDDVISMGAPLNGTSTFGAVCAIGLCSAAARQLSPGSRFVKKLQSTSLPSEPSYSSIWTAIDEWVIPSSSGTFLPGAAHVGVQEVCPLRPLEHYTMALDGATFAIVSDALDNPGPASADRARRSACGTLLVPDFDAASFLLALPPIVVMPLVTTVGLAHEPPLQPYAQ
ncbi:lipase family alpha/beta hydrolase [Amycolatopsis azurea]|uniref:lipase family alpha/beta hydrolase n=1 Tax=Amycolatopsis azurea TaxID=36819 RepID=UPI003801AF68